MIQFIWLTNAVFHFIIRHSSCFDFLLLATIEWRRRKSYHTPIHQ